MPNVPKTLQSRLSHEKSNSYPEHSKLTKELVDLQTEANSFKQFVFANENLDCKDLVPHGDAIPNQYSKMRNLYDASEAVNLQNLAIKFRALQLYELEFELFLMFPTDKN